ncbi:unnamed protein product [Rhodiola kirilowii]
MVDQPISAPARITRFPESAGDEADSRTDLGLELGLSANFDLGMRKHGEKVVDDRIKKMKVSMGFTFMQRQELELQACIYKYIDSGSQVPYPLLQPILKSLAGLIHCRQFPFFPNLFGGPVGLSWKGSTDTEPGRCKRTDGKKWRCVKEAMPDFKYCEKHLHRGRHSSRKLVESSMKSSSASSAAHVPASKNQPLRRTA